MVRAVVMALLAGMRERLRGHDLWILTAGVTFYALLAAIPSLVVALRITAAVAGVGRVDSWAHAVGLALPAAQSPGPVIDAFVRRADRVAWHSIVVAVIPASVWGEGLYRGFARVTSVHGGSDGGPAASRWDGWRARLAVVPLLVLSPAGLLAVLSVAPQLSRLFGVPGAGPFGSGGFWRSALAFYIALNVDWIVVSVVLVYAYRVLGPGRPGWRPLLVGSFVTGAFMSGFLQGFVIFLAIPVDLGSPFGGWRGAGAVVAVSLWMWLLTALSVMGYALTLTIDQHWPLRRR